MNEDRVMLAALCAYALAHPGKELDYQDAGQSLACLDPISVEECCDDLVEAGHLKRDGERGVSRVTYEITDTGWFAILGPR